MPYAVVLYLDEEADRLVRRIWAALDSRGVSAPGREETGNRPHVTLALFEDCDPVRLTAALNPALKNATGIPLELGSVGFFLGPRAPAFLAVVPSSALLELHGRVQAVLKPMVTGNSAFYEPRNWLPHCTVAMRTLEVVAEVVSTMADRVLPIRGRASAARLVWLPQRVLAMQDAGEILRGLRPPPPSWAAG